MTLTNGGLSDMSSPSFIQIDNPDLSLLNGTNNQFVLEPLKARESKNVQLTFRIKDSESVQEEIKTRREGLGIKFKLNEFYQ